MKIKNERNNSDTAVVRLSLLAGIFVIISVFLQNIVVVVGCGPGSFDPTFAQESLLC